MNNWDERPYVEVVLGNVAEQYVEQYCKDTVSKGNYTRYTSDQLPDAVYFVIHRDDNISDSTLENALVCLADHTENTNLEDWLDVQGDHCVDTNDWLWVDEKYGVYHAQGIDVKVWYLEA